MRLCFVYSITLINPYPTGRRYVPNRILGKLRIPRYLIYYFKCSILFKFFWEKISENLFIKITLFCVISQVLLTFVNFL